jgi:hypothetical protein
VRPESGRRWGRMSGHQMVCHLADSFRMRAAGLSRGRRRIGCRSGQFTVTVALAAARDRLTWRSVTRTL